jgi:hypothetical protein
MPKMFPGKSKIVLVSSPASVELPDCWTTCINPAGPYIESTGSNTQTWGNPLIHSIGKL